MISFPQPNARFYRHKFIPITFELSPSLERAQPSAKRLSFPYLSSIHSLLFHRRCSRSNCELVPRRSYKFDRIMFIAVRDFCLNLKSRGSNYSIVHCATSYFHMPLASSFSISLRKYTTNLLERSFPLAVYPSSQKTNPSLRSSVISRSVDIPLLSIKRILYNI